MDFSNFSPVLCFAQKKQICIVQVAQKSRKSVQTKMHQLPRLCRFSALKCEKHFLSEIVYLVKSLWKVCQSQDFSPLKWVVRQFKKFWIFWIVWIFSKLSDNSRNLEYSEYLDNSNEKLPIVWQFPKAARLKRGRAANKIIFLGGYGKVYYFFIKFFYNGFIIFLQ